MPMDRSENFPANSYPLAVAARFLGVSADALRMRIRRGRAKGFKRGGRLFVVLEAEDLAQAAHKDPAAAEPAAHYAPGKSDAEKRRDPLVAPRKTALRWQPSGDLVSRLKQLEEQLRQDREFLGALHARVALLEGQIADLSAEAKLPAAADNEELVLVPEPRVDLDAIKPLPAETSDPRADLIARLATLGLEPEERRVAAEIVERLLGERA